MTNSRTRQASALLFAVAAIAATILTVASSASADPSIKSKQAQAQAVLAQIDETNEKLEKVIESYNYATEQLATIEADLASNARHLIVARRSLGVAQEHIADRLRAIYVNGDGGGAVEIILGAESLDDLLNRLDMVQRVGDQDSQVLKDVKVFGREVEQRRKRLTVARVAQARVVAERAAQRRSIQDQLGRLQRLRASIKDEIARLEAAEARRQALLAAQARARLAEQRVIAAAQTVPTAGIDAGTATFASPDSSASDTAIGPAPPAQYGGVVGIAMQYLGVPYVWGGSSPAGFDCSGLVQYVYGQVGVSLPHHAASQFSYGVPVSQSELEPGDLVFYSGLGHVGIYIGGGQYVHAPQTGDVVKISSIYRDGWVGARRL